MKLDDRRFLLVKRGLYYRPDNCGYTGIKDRAGRYLESDAMPLSGVTAIAEEDAPMFSSACFEDIKIDYLLTKITDLEALVGELGEALVTAMIPIEAMLLSGADAAHCQDVRDAMHDAQATARATLAKLEKARGKDQEHG